MKKTFTLLFILLAIAFQGFAQDTLTGVVSRVAAPYFEQNVCDSRFAIMAEGETYYVMVDNYWPNPYLEELVIHYDTIPVGNDVEVMGTILGMEDGNGDAFRTIDISKNLNSTHRHIPGFFGYRSVSYSGPDPVLAASFDKYTGTEFYFITINGELQTERPFVINGRTLVEDKRYLFVGESDSLTDYNGNTFLVYELIDAQPMDQEDLSINGILTTENDLCLSWPREESPYLSVFDGEAHHYVTNKGALQNRYTLYDIRNAFGNNTTVDAGGFAFIRYDLFGAPFNAFEVIKMETEEQTTLAGTLTVAGTPYIGMGPPIPGADMAFSCYGDYYMEFYIDNPKVWDPQSYSYLYNAFIIGNDTIYYDFGQEATATFIPSIVMNNYRNPVFYIIITGIDGLTGVDELDLPEIQVFPNPADDVIYIYSKGHVITHVDIMDSKGCLIISKPCRDNNIQFSNLGIHGLLFIQIELSNCNVITSKIIVK
ncbi:MAG: hypothetical protein IKM99_05175 [Bacteroidales bacterium]|nr:hypothetical protein [Bacteroidales bacterium]